MARTNAIAARKTVLSFEADGGTSYLPLAAIRTISYGGSKLSFIDVTNMDSDGNYKEQIPAIFDGGEITVEGVYVPGEAGRKAAHTAYSAQQLCHFKIQLPKATGQSANGDLVSFDGYWGSEGISLDYSKEVTFSTSITITGPVVYTDGN